MTKRRPVYLDLRRIRLPVPGLMSILHRVSGVLMVLAIPLFAALFAQSLSSETSFQAVSAWFDGVPAQLMLVVLAWGLLHHLFAGLRYLALDLGWGLEREQARLTARAVLYGAVALTLVGMVILR
jgi:succinate dehydrogenase / fumarate reductase cytochrome b subunit